MLDPILAPWKVVWGTSVLTPPPVQFENATPEVEPTPTANTYMQDSQMEDEYFRGVHFTHEPSIPDLHADLDDEFSSIPEAPTVASSSPLISSLHSPIFRFSTYEALGIIVLVLCKTRGFTSPPSLDFLLLLLQSWVLLQRLMKQIIKILSILVAISACWITLLETSAVPRNYTWLLPIYLIVSLGCYGLMMVGVGLMRFPTCPQEAGLLKKDIAEAKEFLKQRGVDVGSD